VTFAEHPSFVGDGGPGLYPRQRTLLRLIHLETELFSPYDQDVIGRWAEGFHRGDQRWGVQPDIDRRIAILRDRGMHGFRTVVLIAGRRASKGHLGAVTGAFGLYRLIAMDDPQAAYGIAAGKRLLTLCTATTYEQARDNQFADLYRVVTQGPCFRDYLADASHNRLSLWTPADLRRIAERGRRDRRFQVEQASIRASAVAPNASGVRGSACTCLIFDEFAHSHEGTESTRTGEQVYRALVPSLGQVHPDGMVYIPTSPWTKETHAHRLYEMALEVDEAGDPKYPDMLLVQLPSWGPYEDAFDVEATEGRVFASVPMAPDDRVRQEREADPVSYAVEYLAQWREVEEGFLDPRSVESIFDPFCEGCGRPVIGDEACGQCGGSPRVLSEEETGRFVFMYRGHGDPASRGTNFAYVLAHCEDFTFDENVWSHVLVDRVRIFRPADYPNRTIPFDRVEDEIVADLLRFPSLAVFSYDQFGSIATIPRLRERLVVAGHKATVKEVVFTPQSNDERAHTARTAISRGWVHSYRDTLAPMGRSQLELELKSLKLRGGRVVAPTGGPIRTKDAVDCLFVLISELLKDQLIRLPIRRRLSETKLQAGALGGYRSTPIANGPSPISRSPRDVLRSYSTGRRREFPYGWLDVARRPYL
jgi:hypothetical protein